MKVVQVTTSSKGGAGIAALRLHKALRKAGVASAYISTDLTIDFNNNALDDPFFRYIRPNIFQKIIRKIRRLVAPTYPQKLVRHLRTHSDDLEFEMLSTPFSAYKVLDHPVIKEADIINLHWISKMVDYPSFFSKNEKPIVWTLHDMNPFKGLFHYESDESHNFQAIASIEVKVRALKLAAIQRVEKGVVVSPSNWLLQKAEQSSVFNYMNRVVIKNSLDLNAFLVKDRTALRASKEIDENEFVLLFTAGKIGNRRKGLKLLVEALHLLEFPVTLLTVGKGTLQTKQENLRVVHLGFAETSEELSNFYNMADAFVLPSTEDNLPNTMLESFACGTPVISFPNGGMKEHIENGRNGFIAREISARALATAIEKFYNSERADQRSYARSYAEGNFGPEKQAEAYKKVYLALTN